MARFYAFERTAGKVEYLSEENCVTGGKSIKGQLLAFSSLHKRTVFIQACPSDKCRHIVRHSEVRDLFLGITHKELDRLLFALSVDEVLE